MVEIRLFATLRENRGKILHVPADHVKNGHMICEKLGIEPSDVAIFLINGIHSTLHDPIVENDIIAIFPPVGGG